LTFISSILVTFRLPGESQQIDRIFEQLSRLYFDQLDDAGRKWFGTADVVYLLFFSIVMSFTDHSNPQIKQKQTLEQFIKSHNGINNGANLSPELLTSLWNRIKKRGQQGNKYW
jgi:brefeldin A-resistance guanine nucleotide exchange factor 1